MVLFSIEELGLIINLEKIWATHIERFWVIKFSLTSPELSEKYKDLT